MLRMECLETLYSEFYKKIVQRKSPDEYKKEQIKILSVKIDKVNESLEKIERLKEQGEIEDGDYLDLKVQYVNDLIKYQKELSVL